VARGEVAVEMTSITDLQDVMSVHWRAPVTARLGGWLLRAAEGFTGRANSVLPLGAPSCDLPEALRRVVTWYADRGLPATAALAGPTPGGAPDDDGPAAAALAACRRADWRVVPDGSALVLTAPTATLRGIVALPPRLRLTLADDPDPGWLASYRYRGQDLPPVAVPLLVSAPAQTFVSIRDERRTVAVARGSIGAGWAGLTAVQVDPQARRLGLGTALLAAVADWAWRAGAASTWLQVAESNVAAQRLYAGAGFEPHHRYDYLRAPAGRPR
jgi:N-acetylglutamate synthase